MDDERIHAARSRLIRKCKSILKIEHSPPYTSILELLVKLRDSVRPWKIPSSARRVKACSLRLVLNGIFDQMEAVAPWLSLHLIHSLLLCPGELAAVLGLVCVMIALGF